MEKFQNFKKSQSFQNFKHLLMISGLRETCHMEKAESLVIHTGTNDIQQKISTIKIVKKLVKVIKEIDSEKKQTEIIFSGLIQREDHDFRDQTEEINGKLERYCESKRYNRFAGNSKIDGVFLNRSKLHLNKKGTALLSRNIANVLKYI